MHIPLRDDYHLTIAPGKSGLLADPVALVESLSEPDLEALARAVAASRPVLALELALSILREADTAEVLHASLDAIEALRRDLAEYAGPDAEVWDGTAARPLTPEERGRVLAVVGSGDLERERDEALKRAKTLEAAIREWIRAGTTAGSSEELRYARVGLRAALSATDEASA